jgi:hypothetical protein
MGPGSAGARPAEELMTPAARPLSLAMILGLAAACGGMSAVDTASGGASSSGASSSGSSGAGSSSASGSTSGSSGASSSGASGASSSGSSGASSSGSSGGNDASAPDGSSPLVCTSGKQGGVVPGATHDPGQACLACHASVGGPRLPFAGTVYPTLHEPDSCVGLSGVLVKLVDANGTAVTAVTNAGGNFLGAVAAAFKPPYTVAVVGATGTTTTATSLHTGVDCNGCHTADGAAGAAGRIIAP